MILVNISDRSPYNNLRTFPVHYIAKVSTALHSAHLELHFDIYKCLRHLHSEVQHIIPFSF